jgi:hypothetical protein
LNQIQRAIVQIKDFLFADKFINLTDEQLQVAIDMVKSQWQGVPTMWSNLPYHRAFRLRRLLYNYLLAWELMSLYPTQTTGVSGMGGLPLTSKQIGPVALRFRNSVAKGNEGTVFDALTTNWFGEQALLLMQSNSDNYRLYR